MSKFDVVLGNPPYQGEVGSQNSLWMKFLAVSFDLVEKDGFVCFVTPTNWSCNEKLYATYFSSHTPMHINIDECKKHFKGVSSTFSWYVIQNSASNDCSITIQTEHDIVELKSWPVRPFGSHPASIPILDKMIKSHHQRIKAFSVSVHNTCKHYGRYSHKETKEFNVPVIKSVSASKINYGWGRIADPSLDTPRVIGFSMIGGWLSKNGLKNMPQGCQTTQSLIHLPVANEKEGEHLIGVLNSKLFQFAVKMTNSNRTVRLQTLRDLPLVDLTRSWTDNELYEHFALTEEEVNIIEETIK